MAKIAGVEDSTSPVVGSDGWATLAISCALLIASLGLTLLVTLIVVFWKAWMTPAVAPRCGRVIVPGHRLGTDGQPSLRFCQRLDRAAALLDASPTATVHLLGGRAIGSTVSEADVGASYLVARGVCSHRIRSEDRSRHTLENLQQYRATLATSSGDPVILVTSRFHLARAGMMAHGLNVPHSLCAAEDRPRFCWSMLHEAFLIHWYLTGRTVARWTRNRRMLARIS